jgi:hypothetical protein
MNTHENFTAFREARSTSDRSFGFVVGGILTALGLLPLVRGHAWRPWLVAIGLILIAAAVVCPSWLHTLNLRWTRLGTFLHSIVSPVITALMFYLVVVPTAFVIHRMGKDSLKIRAEPQQQTYWSQRQSGPEPKSMKFQF